MHYIKNNKFLAISSAIVIGIVFIWLLFIGWNPIVGANFWDSSSSLIGGAIGGGATIITVFFLVETNKKQDEKKELARYSKELVELLDNLAFYIRKIRNLDDLREEKDEKYLELKESEVQYLHEKQHVQKLSDNNVWYGKLDSKKARYKRCIRRYTEAKKEFEEENKKDCEYDDKIITYIMQIKIQLKVFISSYHTNKEAVKKAEILYERLRVYQSPEEREKLDIDVLDRISDEIEEFINNILENILTNKIRLK